jgi:hypothetical protein
MFSVGICIFTAHPNQKRNPPTRGTRHVPGAQTCQLIAEVGWKGGTRLAAQCSEDAQGFCGVTILSYNGPTHKRSVVITREILGGIERQRYLRNEFILVTVVGRVT